MSNTGRFDKFNDQARRVFGYAQEEAQALEHHYVGTEHLLLGLVHDEDNTASVLLRSMGVEAAKIRSEVEFIVGLGDPRFPQPQSGLTPRSKKVIELAVNEARRLGHHYIGTEHILLGILDEGQGIAAGVLESQGVHLEKVRFALIPLLSNPQQSISEQAQQPNEPSAPQSRPVTRPRADSILQTQSTKPYAGYPFTDQAHKVIEAAREEALSFQHNYLGTEHLLLGLLRQSNSVAGAVLQNLGVELDSVRRAIEFIIGRGDIVVASEIALTPRAKKTVELASDEAKQMHNDYLGTEHLLLGTVVEGGGIAVGVLESLNINLGMVRAETMRVLQYAQREP
jgi:ATP-dependent Clp protease ATP-binding subunit ClpA